MGCAIDNTKIVDNFIQMNSVFSSKLIDLNLFIHFRSKFAETFYIIIELYLLFQNYTMYLYTSKSISLYCRFFFILLLSPLSTFF